MIVDGGVMLSAAATPVTANPLSPSSAAQSQTAPSPTPQTPPTEPRRATPSPSSLHPSSALALRRRSARPTIPAPLTSVPVVAAPPPPPIASDSPAQPEKRKGSIKIPLLGEIKLPGSGRDKPSQPPPPPPAPIVPPLAPPAIPAPTIPASPPLSSSHTVTDGSDMGDDVNDLMVTLSDSPATVAESVIASPSFAGTTPLLLGTATPVIVTVATPHVVVVNVDAKAEEKEEEGKESEPAPPQPKVEDKNHEEKKDDPNIITVVEFKPPEYTVNQVRCVVSVNVVACIHRLPSLLQLGVTSLMTACASGDVAAVKAYAKRDSIDINARDKVRNEFSIFVRLLHAAPLLCQAGWTALMYAVSSSSSSVTSAVCLEIVNVLLSAGAAEGLTYTCNVNKTALSRAVLSKRYCAVDTMCVAAIDDANAHPKRRNVGLYVLVAVNVVCDVTSCAGCGKDAGCGDASGIHCGLPCCADVTTTSATI